MPTSEPFNDGGAFTKMRLKARCPFATGAIAPNYVGIRHESFADRNFGMPAGVGATSGSIEDFEPGGQSALIEGASHIPFAMKYRGGKEEMRNPYNTFKVPGESVPGAYIRQSGLGRVPDAPHIFGAPGGVYRGKERFIDRSIGVLHGKPMNTGYIRALDYT